MKIRSLFVLTALLAAAAARVAEADPLETPDALDQGDFGDLAETLAAATHYKSLAPPEQLGLLGFDVGIELSSTGFDEGLFDRASDGDYGTGSLLLPKLHAHKGLPFGIDIGASIGLLPGSDLVLIGAELRYAVVEGGVVTPAVGLRVSHSRGEGSDTIELNSTALEVAISKGFVMFTPYAGAGVVYSDVTPLDAPALQEESFDQTKLFLGVNVNLLTVNVAVELDRTGEDTSVGAKLGLRF